MTMLHLYSVTVEWEDEREGEWVQTLLVAAHDDREALDFHADRWLEENMSAGSTVTRTEVREWRRDGVMGTLDADENDNPVWNLYLPKEALGQS
ncbi:MAG: hypothetical protein RJA59_272 [Pseudomonadota bacterium]|jgi:hypothetical protein